LEYFFLGDEELVIGFSFIGIHGIAVKDADEAVMVFKQITEGEVENCQVLIMTEETADWLGEHLVNWQLQGRYPLIVEIPGLSGRFEGRKTLVDSIREAIGLHV
jgi:V/A-type H+-transporting ATPase subunit F